MMDLERFENLWSQRDQLEESARAELMEAAKSNAECKAYAEGGSWVHGLLQDVEPEKASPDFAYRMRVFAANNTGSDAKQSERTWMRWPVVTVGAAVGVAAMVLTLSPILQNDTVATGVPGSVIAAGDRAAPHVESIASSPQSVDNLALAASTDTLSNSDSLKSVERDIPDYHLQTVSGSGE